MDVEKKEKKEKKEKSSKKHSSSKDKEKSSKKHSSKDREHKSSKKHSSSKDKEKSSKRKHRKRRERAAPEMPAPSEPTPAPAPRPLKPQASLARIANGKREELGDKIEDLFDIGRELGSGAFSVVREATEKSTGDKYAVKIIEKNSSQVQQEAERLAIELEVLRSVQHPNIIMLKEVFETDDYLFIITELVTGGELFDRIVEKGSYTEHDAAELVSKFCEALRYLHAKNIVHRDLKPENLLLKSREEDTEVKLADFGLSKIVGEQVMMQTACGTPGYVAPEILQAQGYGQEVDMWSVGVITYILLCGFPPFYSESIPELFESIMSADFDYPADYWDHISDDAIDFVDKLLVVEPEKRLTAEQALSHKWLQGNAPDTQLRKVGAKLDQYNSFYREQSRAAASGQAQMPGMPGMPALP